MANTNLKNAKNAQNDEFYTQLEDIETELKYYLDHFKGKTVFCNCDDPFLSLKELVSTGKDIIAILRNNIFTHMDINSVCALGGVA